jgi:glycosyltransferase involved in cell wall biosynthesis
VRVAIVHHWFVTQGGGERVAELFAEMFPDADIFTLVVDPEHLPKGISLQRVTTSFLQRIPKAKHLHRNFFPLYPLAVEQLDLSSYDLVLTSDSGPMKGVITNQNAIHVCYCHSPMRYIWDGYHSYIRDMSPMVRIPFALSAHYLRNWDYLAAQRVTHFIANSDYVAGRIQHFYGRESKVIHPPIDTQLGSISDKIDDYYLAVGRLVPYKKTQILIEACNKLQRRLLVVGVGPEETRLRSMAGSTIRFMNSLLSSDLWDMYAHCRALLFAADEDFGMVPLESQACGRPVIAYGKGGSLETVRPVNQEYSYTGNQATGLFFYEQTADAVADAILTFESIETTFSPKVIQEHARKFDTAIFIDQVHTFLSDKLTRK